jgi:hypothetical protein
LLLVPVDRTANANSMGESMSNEQLRRACVRILMNHLTGGEEERPVALGCKLQRSDMRIEDVAKIWAGLGDELRQRGDSRNPILPDDWGPLREMLTEYRAVMRERLHPERKGVKAHPRLVRVAERRACD